ncbi:ogr/Delta-like zinc finger family protein [Yersinia intermedia]|nr:ogr/Delta-like zinc finger family protein [Yersinia intermedia]
MSENTKERYHQRQNIHCGHTFKTMETFESSIMRPGEVIPAIPHPERSGQQNLWM